MPRPTAWSGSSRFGKVFVEDCGVVVRPAVGVEGETGDDANTRPAERSVQTLGGRARLGVEREQRITGVGGELFEFHHQPPGDTQPAGARVDHEFGDLGPPRLIRRPRRVQLDGAEDASVEVLPACNKDEPARVQRADRPPPPVLRILIREGIEKTHRSAVSDGFDQQRGELA